MILFKKFKKEEGVIHGFSTKDWGDMSFQGEDSKEKIRNFLNTFNLDPSNLVLMEQVHDGKVKIVSQKERGKRIKEVDGLVTKDNGLILGVKTADCLSLFFFDPERRVIGLSHAGWQGLLSGIIPETLKEMISLGVNPSSILVGVGPSISSCCYDIPSSRAQIFKEKFGDLKGMLDEKGERIYLDLKIPALFQLKKEGIKEKNTEICQECSSCQNKKYFSFRKEKTAKRNLGIISLIN